MDFGRNAAYYAILLNMSSNWYPLFTISTDGYHLVGSIAKQAIHFV